MTNNTEALKASDKLKSTLTLYQLFDRDVLADPYPPFHHLRTEDPNLSLIPSAGEELLRYDCPSHYTTRLAPANVILGGKKIRERQPVIAVMAPGNRDPERFPDPDRLDITRKDNRHLAFGWAAHFCFGAALARIEAQSPFEAILRRMPDLKPEPDVLAWRTNLGLRGLTALPVTF